MQADMIRKDVLLGHLQSTRLEEYVKRTGLSASETIRRALDYFLDVEEPKLTRVERHERIRQAAIEARKSNEPDLTFEEFMNELNQYHAQQT